MYKNFHVIASKQRDAARESNPKPSRERGAPAPICCSEAGGHFFLELVG